MRANLKKLLSTAAVVAALAGGPAVYAYAQTSNQGSGGMMGQDGQGGMMGQSGQGGMMGMMQQMSQMMDTCNQMMKDMAQHHGPETPKEENTPEKKG